MKTVYISLAALLLTLFNTKAQTLPSRVNNAETKYFRSIFRQVNNECTQAAGIGYIFTYEMNAARGTSAATNDSIYPTHFTYNYLNNGNGANEVLSNEAFEIAIDHGIPSVSTYGGMNPFNVTGWMTGYDEYYAAMQNRVEEWVQFPTMNNEASLLAAKKWLFNHDGATEGYGGSLTMNTFMGGWKFKTIPEGSYEAGKKIGYIPQVVTTGGHTMTYIGYDDNIEVDLNEDGQITNDIDITGDGNVNMKDWEKGAFIVANSHGANWQNGGFCYWMYSAAARHPQGVYGIKVNADYTPTHTIKVQMTSSMRKRINIKAGIATSASATAPEFTKTFAAFNYKRGGLLPMIDEGNNNPIEIGLDISDLTAKITDLSTCKIFLEVVADANAGTGQIVSMSCISYTGTDPIEFPSEQSNVSIVAGASTTVTAILQDGLEITQAPGAPYNLSCSAKSYRALDLEWTDTAKYESGFKIERAAQQAGPWEVIDSTVANVTSYTNTDLTDSATFYYRVRAFNTIGYSDYSNTAYGVGLVANKPIALNEMWTSLDLGLVGRASETVFQNDTFYIHAGDGDIWGTADAFQFVYTPWAGDAVIVAQVSNYEGVQGFTMAGLMMRESLDPDAAHASFLIINDPGTIFRKRTATGAASTQVLNPKNNIDAPYYLMLERKGNAFNGYHSPDGIAWTLHESNTIAMSQDIYIGMAATSHLAGENAMFEFTHVGASSEYTEMPELPTVRKNLWMYPNPAKELINFNSTDELSMQAKVFDLTGKLMLSEQISTKGSVNIQSLNPGMYVVKTYIYPENRADIFKLVIE